MNQDPESSLPRSRVPNGFALACILLIGLVGPLAGQGPDRITVEADFAKDPGGTVLGRVMRGAAVTFGATRDGWREVTLEGWVASDLLRADRRDGFDLSVASRDGAPLRTTPASAAPARATGRLGALFDRVEARGGWIHVRRTGWVPVAATREAQAAAAAPNAAQPPPPPPVIPDSGQVSLRSGSQVSASQGGAPIGKFEVAQRVELVERRAGWNRVRLELWVPDAELSGAPEGGPITAAAILAEPDRYVGATVEWSLQVLAVQKADELRPELPRGQPYVLARGPLPETAFVYLVVQGEEVAAFENLPPLTEVRVRATVRAGRTRHLPTPVLDLVRRLD